jgi:hypothetical protein
MKSIFSGLKSSFDQSNSVEPSNDRRRNSQGIQPSEIIDAVEVGNMSGRTAAVSSAAATFAVLSGLLRPRAAFAEETPPMQLEDDSSRTTGFPFVQAAGVDADTASNSAAASLKELADEDQSVSGPYIAMPSGRGSLRRVVNNEGSPGSTDFQVPSPTSEQARGSLSTAELTVDASVQTNGGPNVESRGGDPEDEDFDFGTLVLEPEVVAQIDNSPDVERYTGGRANEDAAVDTVVVALRATDMDGDAVKYALTDSTGNPVPNNNFEIVGN